MAGYIKGITIEFGANTEKLNKALGKLQGKLNKTQAELKQIDRSLRFNPRNTTLLQQKFKLLQTQVTQTSRKLDALRKMEARLKSQGVDENSAQYRQLQREIIKTENQLKQAQGALKQFGSVGKQQALAVGAAFKTAGSKIKSAGRTITTSVSVYGMAGIYAGSKLIEMSEKQAQAEQKLAEIYKTRMGVGKKAVKSTLDLAAAEQKLGVVGDEVQLAGAQQLATYAKTPGTVNAMLPALNNLLVQQKGMNATQEDAVGLANMFGKAMMGQTGALKRAGISFTDAQADVLKYGTEEEKAAMIAEVVTQNVGNMNAEFAKTDAGKIQQAKNALGDMGEQIGAVLLPAVADLVSWFQVHLLPAIQRVITYFQQHPALAKFALAAAAITAALGPLLMILGSLVSAIGGVISIMAIVGPAIGAVALPVLAVVAAIAAAIAIGIKLYKNWDTIKAKAKVFVNAVKATFNAFKTNVTTTFNRIKTAITTPITTAMSKVRSIISKIKGFFPLHIGKIFSGMKLPHFSIKGSAPFGIGGKGVKPSISVSWYKKAMQQPYLFSNATLFGAGERGDEMLYGRQALLKDIATAVGSNSGQIIMNVYGSEGMSVTELANAVERKLIQAQKRRTEAWA